MSHPTSRVLALLNLLQSHRQWAGPELGRRLGVTGRTLRRDIDRLRELGYRIEATRGVAGGYRLAAGSELPPLLLSDDEAVALAIGLRLAATQGLVDGELTSLTALAKFEQVLPSALRQRVNALAASVQSATPRGGPISPELLGQLALACRDRERVRFGYSAADGAESTRLVEPHSLVTAERNWFLLCWDLNRNDWRTFRVDRISALFGTRLHFAARELPAASAAEFLTNALSTFRHGQHSAEVLLRMPLDELRARLGRWAGNAVAVDEHSTKWPIGASSLESLLGMLAWIPPGVEYELRGSEEFLSTAREVAKRMTRSLGPHRPAEDELI